MNLPQISNLNTNLCTLHPWGDGHDGSASYKDGGIQRLSNQESPISQGEGTLDSGQPDLFWPENTF